MSTPGNAPAEKLDKRARKRMLRAIVELRPEFNCFAAFKGVKPLAAIDFSHEFVEWLRGERRIYEAALLNRETAVLDFRLWLEAEHLQ